MKRSLGLLFTLLGLSLALGKFAYNFNNHISCNKINSKYYKYETNLLEKFTFILRTSNAKMTGYIFLRTFFGSKETLYLKMSEIKAVASGHFMMSYFNINWTPMRSIF